MAAPEGGGNGIEKLFPELSDGPSQPDSGTAAAAPALPLPPVLAAGAGGQGGGSRSVMYRHDKLRQVVENMREDLQSLQFALTALNDSAMGRGVGQWDVAKSLGTKVGAAHQNMLDCVKAYGEAYEAVIFRLEKTVQRYADAERKATETNRSFAAGLTAADGVQRWPTS